MKYYRSVWQSARQTVFTFKVICKIIIGIYVCNVYWLHKVLHRNPSIISECGKNYTIIEILMIQWWQMQLAIICKFGRYDDYIEKHVHSKMVHPQVHYFPQFDHRPAAV